MSKTIAESLLISSGVGGAAAGIGGGVSVSGRVGGRCGRGPAGAGRRRHVRPAAQAAARPDTLGAAAAGRPGARDPAAPLPPRPDTEDGQ